ncbi:hypothetical protein HAX54_030089 [Datura stramonium]|uniref:Uncharacterized protein n=1 Tax=Datura stramonium TaxID=4076 RepID=A0ABS8V9F6_DATST|nr:hypothetical protein [Datura stramonium]
MGATSTNMFEQWKKKGEVQDRKIGKAIMEHLKMLTRHVMETKIWSANAIRIVERMEQIDDEGYFLNDEKELKLGNLMPSLLGTLKKKPESIGIRIETRNSRDPRDQLDGKDNMNAKYVVSYRVNIMRSGKTLNYGGGC